MYQVATPRGLAIHTHKLHKRQHQFLILPICTALMLARKHLPQHHRKHKQKSLLNGAADGASSAIAGPVGEHHLRSPPRESFTGFSAACLRERLAGLEASTAAPGRKSTSAVRSIFSRPFNAAAGGGLSGSAASTLPDLRRCKSFPCGRGGDALAAAVAGRSLGGGAGRGGD